MPFIFSLLVKTGLSQAIASHSFDVTSILSYDEDSGYLYYSTTNNDPRQRQLYRFVKIMSLLVSKGLDQYDKFQIIFKEKIFSIKIWIPRA